MRVYVEVSRMITIDGLFRKLVLCKCEIKFKFQLTAHFML